jgi:hypothetical protein
MYSIFVSSLSFPIIEGIFLTYSSIVKRARRDKRLAHFRSGHILDFLFGGQVV